MADESLSLRKSPLKVPRGLCVHSPCNPTQKNIRSCEERGCGPCGLLSIGEGRCTDPSPSPSPPSLPLANYQLSSFKKGLPLPWVSIEAFLKEGFHQGHSNFVSLSMNGGEEDTKPFFRLLVKRGLKDSKLIFGYGKRNRRLIQSKTFGALLDGMHVTKVLRHGWKRLLVRLRSEKTPLDISFTKKQGKRIRKVRRRINVF